MRLVGAGGSPLLQLFQRPSPQTAGTRDLQNKLRYNRPAAVFGNGVKHLGQSLISSCSKGAKSSEVIWLGNYRVYTTVLIVLLRAPFRKRAFLN